MKQAILKYIQTSKVAFSNLLMYRLNFFLEFIGPAFIFYFVKYNIWSSVFASAGTEKLRGYTLESMLGYHAWVLLVTLLAQSFRGTDIAMDIRYGRISAYLLYPFSFWQYHAARFSAFFALQFLITVATLFLFIAANLIVPPPLIVFFYAFLISLGISCLWFSYNFITGVLAFWLEETWMFRILFIVIAQFFSGAIVPLEFFPSWLRSSLQLTPFPYLTHYPVKLLMGEVTFTFEPLFILTFWILALSCCYRLIWNRGLRLYTGAGM